MPNSTPTPRNGTPMFLWTRKQLWSRLQKAMQKPFFTDFKQVTSYMDSFTNIAGNMTARNNVKLPGAGQQAPRRTHRLDRMRALLERFHNPERSFCSIHIAGSKGKGSTASYIAAGLKAAGIKTGLYMSPHVADHRERFTMAGEFFSDELLLETANEIKARLEGFSFCEDYGENTPTTFELYTLYAFMLFKKSGCQWAVIETGLGGRLDATNAIMPKACVLTPIELEHTEILGDTISLIATEKSKIIKPGVPVFVSFQPDDAKNVFLAEAKAQGSRISFLSDALVSEDVQLPSCGGLDERQSARLRYASGLDVSLSLKMLGKVQADNCALALLALHDLGFYRKGETEKALENNMLPGRMERHFFKRPIYFDGAHTPRSIESAASTFKAVYSKPGQVAIFCCVSGKDYRTLTSMMLKAFDAIIVSRPGTFKKSNPSLIYEIFVEEAKGGFPPDSKTIILEEDPDKALATAIGLCGEQQAILVTGSFYMAGEIKEALCRLTGEKSS